ncbi:hypothetical protein NHX12_001846 [Muraenolepis orangiensis]|uniref:CUB domain-containing protein 1 n=1 Tax=Muraenolepis orangiensis TaxID=630683 RepID=A0A9Q0E0G5_9TELE|nr:hypothetical protein NHX12_001846 [Muraenolepis orangiensis]
MVFVALRGAFEALLVTAAVLSVSGINTLNLSLDPGTRYNISNGDGRQPECLVCTGSGRSQTCMRSVLLRDPGPVSVQFKCPRPEAVIHVEIQRNIDCTTRACSGDIDVGEEPELLRGFDRTFVWRLKASAPKAFLIDFTRTGVRQVLASAAGCPDRHTFTLEAAGPATIGTYCRSGPISQAQVLNQGTFSLHVPAKEKLHTGRFSVSVGEEIKSLAKIKVFLPTGGASPPVELFSPNYPRSFPDDDLVQWEVEVPLKHNAIVQVVNHTRPACRKKETAVEYHGSGRSVLVLTLSDRQPEKISHNFTMTLKSCEMDRTRGDPRGLAVHFRVSTAPMDLAWCTVDLRQKHGLSLYLEKVQNSSKCQMRMTSGPVWSVTVPPYSSAQLSFLDCSEEDVQFKAHRVIECRQLKDCSRKPVPLAVPTLPSCLVGHLSSVTWSLVLPASGSVELQGDGLTHLFDGRVCGNRTGMVLEVEASSDDGRTSLGSFCPRGPIRTIQFRGNVSVTAYSRDWGGSGGLRPSTPRSVLRAHFKEEISERYIFTVSPNVTAPTVLASPGWPGGMKPYTTVSWIVHVPSGQEAHLVFSNLLQPKKCNNRHANVRVQLLGSAEEMYSRREDEEPERTLNVSGSFYLNMSNCMPETGQFSMLAQITLHKSRNQLLTIVGIVVGVLVVLSAVVLTVVCVVIRKKKRAMNRQVSVYNPGGAVFRPGESNAPEEDHIYTCIEDTLVYTHLLKKEQEMEEDGEQKADANRSSTGPTDPHRPPSSLHPEVGVYQPFLGPPVPPGDRPPSRSIEHNDLYDPDRQSDLGDHVSEPAALGARMEPEGRD